MNYNFNKAIASDRLALEIQTSAITVAFDYITTAGNDISIFFKGELSQNELDILTALVAAHVATPLPDNEIKPVAVKQTTVFAEPEFRTKWSGSNAVVVIQPNSSAAADFKFLDERYISGGELIVENAELGDWVEGMIYDADGVIPELYRPILCEGHPVVNKYVERLWVNPIKGEAAIDTSPLAAKISAGLYVRLIYHATAAGIARNAVLNLKLSKKL